jgi:hypothetical protein
LLRVNTVVRPVSPPKASAAGLSKATWLPSKLIDGRALAASASAPLLPS